MPSRWIPVAVVAAALAAQAAPASAVVNSPPAGGHEITVFPERDFVALDPMAPNTDYLVEVIRNGVVIATASTTTGGDGVAEINHPGGVCWDAPSTPDILPGDVVRATEAGSAGTIGDATATSGVSATQAAKVGSQVVIHGTAADAGGAPLPLASLEQRIVNPDLLAFVGKRDIRAPGQGVLSYDAPGSNSWTATYDGLSSGAADAAVAGQTRILSWMGTNPAGDRFGITIFEVGELGGPGFGGCPAGARNAVTNPGTLNAASLAGAADVAFSGAAQPDATKVDLAIGDGAKTINATGTPASGAWTINVTAADLATLAEGTLTAVATYTVPGGTIQGANLDIVKDTIAPGAPSASPASGTYESAQSVVLTSADPAAAVHYTTNGSDPTAASTRSTGQIAVTASQTLKALAVDPAGNASPVTTLDYVITPAAPKTITTPGQTIIVNNTTPTAVRTKLSVAGVTMRKRVSRSSLRRSGLKLNVKLAKGTEVLRVRLYRGSKLIATAMRFPGHSGLYTVRLKTKSVKRLKAGSYVVEVTPGASRQSLGNATRTSFRVR